MVFPWVSSVTVTFTAFSLTQLLCSSLTFMLSYRLTTPQLHSGNIRVIIKPIPGLKWSSSRCYTAALMYRTCVCCDAVHPSGWQSACATGTTNSSSLTLFVLADSSITSKAAKNGKSMCKSLLHNLLLQQQAQSAASCRLNENKPKPSRHLICNLSILRFCSTVINKAANYSSM